MRNRPSVMTYCQLIATQMLDFRKNLVAKPVTSMPLTPVGASGKETSMKRLKRSVAVIGAGLLMSAFLAACGSDTPTEGGTDQSGVASQSGNGGEGESFKILVAQIVTHTSLDESIAGFKAAIADAGLDVTYDEQNANGDQTVVASIAGAAASSNADLILAVATPMAQGLAQAVIDTPILFTSVTDPTDAGLVDSMDAPGANVTGTSDANPVDEQVELIKQFVPDIKTLGVVYNTGERNSSIQVEWVKEAADKLGIEVKEAGATTSTEVQQAAQSLDVDAIYVPTDNTVVSALDSVISVGESKGIPVFAAEGDSVKNGTVATYGLSYYQLGYQTGQMAVRILTEGANPAEMAVETQTDLLLYINKGAADRMDVKIPADLLESADPENIFE